MLSSLFVTIRNVIPFSNFPNTAKDIMFHESNSKMRIIKMTLRFKLLK